jgi:hypothetical protein
VRVLGDGAHPALVLQYPAHALGASVIVAWRTNSSRTYCTVPYESSGPRIEVSLHLYLTPQHV